MGQRTTGGWTRWMVLIIIGVMFFVALGFFRCEADGPANGPRDGYADEAWDSSIICDGFNITNVGA